MRGGAARGACMPSSHVAVAWVSLFSIGKLWSRKSFWIILPFTVAMTLSVVYNRYHYVSDAIAGMIIAFIYGRISRDFTYPAVKRQGNAQSGIGNVSVKISAS